MNERELSNELKQTRRELAALRARRPGGLDRRQKGKGGSGTLPSGEHQYQMLQMVSDNQVGYDFARAHPMVSG